MDDAIALSDCLAQASTALGRGRRRPDAGRAPAVPTRGVLLGATRRIGRIAAAIGEGRLGPPQTGVLALEHGAFARRYRCGFILCAADGRHAAFVHSGLGDRATAPAPDLSRLQLREPAPRVMVSARR